MRQHPSWGLEVKFKGPSVACKDQWIHGQQLQAEKSGFAKKLTQQNPRGLEWNGQYPTANFGLESGVTSTVRSRALSAFAACSYIIAASAMCELQI